MYFLCFINFLSQTGNIYRPNITKGFFFFCSLTWRLKSQGGYEWLFFDSEPWFVLSSGDKKRFAHRNVKDNVSGEAKVARDVSG